MDEAHVEHPVRLIEHEALDVAQIEYALPGEIQQPSGSRDQQIAARLQRLDLRADADAAEHHGGAHRDVLAVGAGAVGDLRGELAGGGEDQRAWRAAGAGGEPLQHRQHECGRLAGAGLGAGEHVAAGEHGGNRPLLNGGRGVVALVGDRAQQLGREPEIGK